MADKKRSVSIVIQARNEAGKAFQSVLSSLTSFAGIAATVTAAAGAMALAISKVTRAAMEQEDADIRLAASLASVGQNTPEARDEIHSMVAALEDLTAVSDEVIQNAMGPLIRTAHLQGQALQEATQAALDYAAGTGGDVAQAATQMANLVAKGTGRLAEINTRFDESTPAAERLNQVIAQINQSFGGFAAATGASLSGALKRVANDWDNLEQAIGGAFVQNQAFREVLDVVSEHLKAGTAWIKQHRAAVDSLADAFGKIAGAGLQLSGMLGEIFFKLGKLDALFEALIDKILGTHLQTGMREIEGALASGSRSLADAGKAIGAGLDSAEKKVVDVAAGIKNKVAPAAVAALSPLDAALKAIGMDTLPEVNAQAQKLNEAFALLSQAFATGQISEEQFVAIRQSLADMAAQLSAAGAQLTGVFESVKVGASEALTFVQMLEEEIAGALVAGALTFGDAMVDAAFGAKIAWGQFFRQLLADIAKAIVRMLILKAISSFGGPTGAVAGNLLGGFGGFAQHGGEVRGGIPGLDSVAALLTPGEIVLPRALARDFEDFSSEARGRRDAGGGGEAGPRPLFGSLQILPRQDDREAADIIERINTMVERRGYRLVSSETLR
jgi:hypothetical protein